MADAALLGFREALRRLGFLLLVIGLQLRIIDADLRGELRQADLGIAQIHGLRSHVLGLVRVVVRLEGGIVRGGACGVFLRGQRQPREFALLPGQRAQPFHLHRRGKARQIESRVELPELRVAPEHAFDLEDRTALRAQHRHGVRLVEFTVDLENRNLRHGVQQFLIADPVAELVGAGDQRLAVHILVEHPPLDVVALCVAQGTVGLTLELRELLLVGLPDFVDRYLAAVHLGGVVGRRQGPVDAPEHEHQPDRSQHDPGQPPLQLVMYRLQHDPTLFIPFGAARRLARLLRKWRSGRDSNPRPPA